MGCGTCDKTREFIKGLFGYNLPKAYHECTCDCHKVPNMTPHSEENQCCTPEKLNEPNKFPF